MYKDLFFLLILGCSIGMAILGFSYANIKINCEAAHNQNCKLIAVPEVQNDPN